MKFSVRSYVQTGFFVLTLAVGLQFLIYVMQARQAGVITVPRPPGVEGFLPIGALMGWKRFIATGQWDPVHPAAMVILAYAVVVSFLLRKTFCSWICPVGTVSEWTWKLGARFGMNVKKPPKWLDGVLRSLKYGLLAFFLTIIVSMGNDDITRFIESPYYKLSDVKMLYFFTRMTFFTAAVLVVLFVLSLMLKNFWCRYLCPYGAFLGLFSWLSFTKVRRNPGPCTRCGLCEKACPSFLPVSRKTVIRSPDCTGCMDCVGACPVDEALAFHTGGFVNKKWRRFQLGIAVTVFFGGVVYLATITGFWRGNISDHEFMMRLKMIDAPGNTHPSVDFRSFDPPAPQHDNE